MRDRLFISYAHQDADWLSRLHIHLAPRVRDGHLLIWDDTCIRAGDNWQNKIDAALERARVALLLVSPNFLASEFIIEKELPRLLSAAADGTLLLLWIPLRASMVDQTRIAQYQAAHSPDHPLATLVDAEVDDALDKICRRVSEAFNAPDASTASVIAQSTEKNSSANRNEWLAASPKQQKNDEPRKHLQHLRAWHVITIIIGALTAGIIIGHFNNKNVDSSKASSGNVSSHEILGPQVEFDPSNLYFLRLTISNPASSGIYEVRNIRMLSNYTKCPYLVAYPPAAPISELKREITLSAIERASVIDSGSFKYGSGDLDRFVIDIKYKHLGIYNVWVEFDFRGIGTEPLNWSQFRTPTQCLAQWGVDLILRSRA